MIITEEFLSLINFKSAGWKIKLLRTDGFTPWGAQKDVAILKRKDTQMYSAEWFDGGKDEIGFLNVEEFVKVINSKRIMNVLEPITSQQINQGIERDNKDRALRTKATKNANDDNFIIDFCNRFDKNKDIKKEQLTSKQFLRRNKVTNITTQVLGLKSSMICRFMDIEVIKVENESDIGWQETVYPYYVLQHCYEILKEQKERVYGNII